MLLMQLAAMVPETAVAAFSCSLAMKGETSDELDSIFILLRNQATKITPQVSGSLIDTCEQVVAQETHLTSALK